MPAWDSNLLKFTSLSLRPLVGLWNDSTKHVDSSMIVQIDIADVQP